MTTTPRRPALVAAAAALLALAGCADDGPRELTAEESARVESTVISADELAAANCQEGAECWVAVDGVVYDVSEVSGWSSGREHQGVMAGTDATEAVGDSPHGTGVLDRLDVVGGYAG